MTTYKWNKLSRTELNTLVAEKVMGLQAQVDFGSWNEHDWKLDSDGNVDTWAMSYEYHNGPMCERCGYSYCEHCDDCSNDPCTKDVPDYAGNVYLARDILKQFKGWQITLLEDTQMYQVCINRHYGEAINEREAICLAALRAKGIVIK